MSRFTITAMEEGIAALSIASDEQPYLDESFVSGLTDAIERIAADLALRVLLVTGGKQYFSAGASRTSLMHADARTRVTTYAAEVPRLLLRIPIPTVAAMEGHAIGGGLALGLWCDAAVLCETALYGANFMALGFTPGMGSTVVLEEAFGAMAARDLLLSGRIVKGRELREAGVPMAHLILPREDVLPRAMAVARDMAQAPREPLVLLKASLARRRAERLELALRDEQANHAALFASDETRRRIDERYGADVGTDGGTR